MFILFCLQNQSGIYYDVDFEQDISSGTLKSQQAAIPMSTYTMSSRTPYYRPWFTQNSVLHQSSNRPNETTVNVYWRV